MEAKEVKTTTLCECCSCGWNGTHADSADKTPVVENMWLLVCPICGGKEFYIKGYNMKKNEKLGEILQLCLQLQASGWGDVNCDFAGHVKKLEVRGFKGGWSETNTDPTFSKYCWYDADFDFVSSNHETKIDDLVSLLKSYIND